MFTFAINLKKKRTQAGLTQMQFAEMLQISFATYNRYEGGTRTPSLDTLVNMAKILNCTTDELLGYSPSDSGYERVKAELTSLGITITDCNSIGDSYDQQKQDIAIIMDMFDNYSCLWVTCPPCDPNEGAFSMVFDNKEYFVKVVERALIKSKNEINRIKLRNIRAEFEKADMEAKIDTIKALIPDMEIDEELDKDEIEKIVGRAALRLFNRKNHERTEPAPTDTQKK